MQVNENTFLQHLIANSVEKRLSLYLRNLLNDVHYLASLESSNLLSQVY